MTDGSARRRSSAEGERRKAGTSGELQQAVERFEQAVQELVGSATSEFSDRATTFLNETTSKLERELGGGTGGDEYGNYGDGYGDGYGDDYGDGEVRQSDAAARMAARRRARARARSERVMERNPRLERDDDNAKIVGVCAGIANYYGVEAWVVRCIAVTGLLFFGSIVFPAYWIMYFVMDDPKAPAKSEKQSSRKRRRKNRRRDRSAAARAEESDMATARQSTEPLSPRRNLRNVQADLQEVELRLRRMETHVTSGQYELQRELHKIESDNPPAGRPASA